MNCSLNIKYKDFLDEASINTPLRLSHFFAQIEHESGLKSIEENLNYSAKALLSVFGKYFDKNNVYDYARKPILIANRVYANRMGNSNEYSGDGWKYRGRGFIQITGKNNYRKLEKALQLNCINDPDLLLKEENAIRAAIWYWNETGLNKYADKDDVDAVSDKINIGRLTSKYGDSNGFKHRNELLKKYKEIFMFGLI